MMLLGGKFSEGDVVEVDARDGELTFERRRLPRWKRSPN